MLSRIFGNGSIPMPLWAGSADIWQATSGEAGDLYFDDALRPADKLSPFDWRCSYCGNVHSGGTYKCPDCGANKGA